MSPTVWIMAMATGVVVVAVVGLTASFIARRLPPGRGREMVGFGPNCVVMLRRLRADRRLPVRARLALGAAMGYLLSPIQLIPNVIPVLGQVDDLAVVTLALRYSCRRLPRDDVLRAWPGDPSSIDRLLGPRARQRPVHPCSRAGGVTGISGPVSGETAVDRSRHGRTDFLRARAGVTDRM